MLPARLQDPLLFLEVELDTWRAVLDATGEADRLSGGVFTHQELIASLTETPGHPEFESALEAIHELGTDDGRNHIEQLASEQNITLPVSASDTPARQFVAHLILLGEAEQKLKALLHVSQFTFRSASSGRTYREFVGRASDTLREGLDASRLKDEIVRWCREHQKNDVVTVHSHFFNGEWYCHVVRGDAMKRVMELRDDEVLPLVYRPAATDLLRYDPKTGRVGIATRYGQMVDGYRGVLGKFLVGDSAHFSGENICSLKPLQVHGNELLSEDRLPLEIQSVKTVELLWRRGDRDKVWVGGRDCFKVLQDLRTNLREGELVEAKLAIHFAAGGRPGHVILKVPNIIDIKASGNEALIERFLDSVGIRGSFESDGMPRTFWDLFPWRLKELEWRRWIGPAFDELQKRRLLRPVTLAAVAHPDHSPAGAALDVIGVQGIGVAAAVGVSANHAIGARLLTSSDIEGYELHVPTLVAEVQLALGLTGECTELDNGLWSIGRRTLQPDYSIVGFICARQPADTIGAVVESEARRRGGAPFIVYPECGTVPTIAAATIACRLPHGPFGDALERIVVQLGWESLVPANLWSSALLILDTVGGRAWYRGVLLSELRGGTHPFKFAVAVAKARGAVVRKQDLNALLSPSRTDDDVAKHAKRDFNKALEASFKALARDVPSDARGLFVPKSGGYAFQGTATIVAEGAGVPAVTGRP